jgi:hypothetical protein
MPVIERGVGDLILRVKRVKPGPDAHLVVWPHAVVAPPEATVVDVVGGDVPADAALPTGHPDNDLVADHQRHTAHRLAGPDGGVLGPPDDVARLRIERKHLAVEGGEQDTTVGIGQAAGLRPAAGAPHRRFQIRDLGPELPLDNPLTDEVERVDVVRVGHDPLRWVALKSGLGHSSCRRGDGAQERQDGSPHPATPVGWSAHAAHFLVGVSSRLFGG